MSFGMNAPVMLIELSAYVTGLVGFISLVAVACWKPAMLRSWFLIVGFIGLLPTLLLLLARFGINLYPIVPPTP